MDHKNLYLSTAMTFGPQDQQSCSKSLGAAEAEFSAAAKSRDPHRYGSHKKQLVGGDWNMTVIFPYIGNNME